MFPLMFDPYDILDALADDAKERGRLDEFLKAVLLWSARHLKDIPEVFETANGEVIEWFNPRGEAASHAGGLMKTAGYTIVKWEE